VALPLSLMLLEYFSRRREQDFLSWSFQTSLPLRMVSEDSDIDIAAEVQLL